MIATTNKDDSCIAILQGAHALITANYLRFAYALLQGAHVVLA
jgi:hypothetical protein